MIEEGEISANNELRAGNFYHCFDRETGQHSIKECKINHMNMFYFEISRNVSPYRLIADDEDNQALERFRLFKIKIPKLITIDLCSKHNGSGFVSDCAICNE